jgi:predicted alpha/beta superfamily hydrolase
MQTLMSRRTLLTFLLGGLLLTRISAQHPTPAGTFPDVYEKVFHSGILDEDRTLYIHVPEENGSFPVLYLLDAQSVQMYGEALRITKSVEKVGPHIIVGIVTSGNRNRDMIPAEVPDRPGSGEAAAFLEFLTNELQPYVDREIGGKGRNILYGVSNAGLFTVFALLSSPDHFEGYISGSTMIGHCPEYMNALVEHADPEALEGKRLYMNYGGNGEYAGAEKYLPAFHQLLKKHFGESLQSTLQVFPNAGHVPPGTMLAGLVFVHQETPVK